MKRKLKFRAWINEPITDDLDDVILPVGFWPEGSPEQEYWWCLCGNGDVTWGDCNAPRDPDEINLTIEQYTGLYDGNGVEICEGDLYMNGESLRVIKYMSGNFVAVTPDGREGILLSYIYRNGRNKVAGNIHENPERLKDGA